jgi:hypothetical protein
MIPTQIKDNEIVSMPILDFQNYFIHKLLVALNILIGDPIE